MNFSIFCSNFSLQSSCGLDIVEIAGFRRNSSNLGTTSGIKEESSEQNNNLWKYLSFFQIWASTIKLINYFNYDLVLLRVSFLSCKNCSDILLFTLWTRRFFHSFFFVLWALAPGSLFSFIISSIKQPRIFFFFRFRVKLFNQC